MLITTHPSKSGKTMYTVLEIQNHQIKLQSKKKAMLVKNLLSERRVTIESVKVNKLCKLVINTIDCGRITKQDYNTLLTLTTNGDTTNEDSNDYQTTSPSNIEILGQTDSGDQPEWTHDDLLCGQQRVQISSEQDGRRVALEMLLGEAQPTGENSGLSTQRELSLEERFEQYDRYLTVRENSSCEYTSRLAKIRREQCEIALDLLEIKAGIDQLKADQLEIKAGIDQLKADRERFRKTLDDRFRRNGISESTGGRPRGSKRRDVELLYGAFRAKREALQSSVESK